MGVTVVPQVNGQSSSLEAVLSGSAKLLLDGATGTELERRGAPTSLPLWTATALLNNPELIIRIHSDYVAAGAELLIANTFRVQRRTLARGGVGQRARELAARAVELARRAAQSAETERAVFVLGSAPPLEDCYRPDLVPSDEDLATEHEEHAANLAAAGVDGILIETMNTIREAKAALRAGRATNSPVLVSFACGEHAQLLSGEPLTAALAAIADEEPAAVLVNCLPPSRVSPCLPVLRASGIPFGVYANLGEPTQTGRSEDMSPAKFASHASAWRDAGARIVGGCCGTTPEHIRAIATRLRD